MTNKNRNEQTKVHCDNKTNILTIRQTNRQIEEQNEAFHMAQNINYEVSKINTNIMYLKKCQ